MIFLTGPAQKSFKYGTGPPQQEKLTEYTGPAQDTEDDRVFNKQTISLHSVFKMKDKARACVAVGGGVFEGRKVWNCVSITAVYRIFE